jgi:site-specific recombinase XerD
LATLSDALTAYSICAKAEGKSPRTVSWTGDAIRYFGSFLGGDAELQDITANELRRFIIALQQRKAFSGHRFTRTQERGLSPESIASYVRAIKAFFSFLEREELMAENPIKKVKTPKTPKKIMPTFSEQDIEKLLAQPNKKTSEGYRDYVVMLTFLDTGLRLSELCGLKVDDVDLQNGYLKVMGKGQKERYVPIGVKVSKALLKYKMLHRQDSGCDSFFLTRDGRPLPRRRVQDLVRSYGTKAGIKVRCSPHTFRSSSAVLYLRNGGDPFTLQRKLGHSSLAMTRRYSNLLDSDVRAAHLKFSPADRLRV